LSRPVRLTLLFACGVFALVAIGALLRNYEFDTATKALKSGDYGPALQKLKALASLGDSRAQYILGDMYARGVGVDKNDDQAINWFRRAAIGVHGETDPAAAAELAVAKSYAEGIGVKPDQAESLKWFRRAADGGSKEATVELEKSRGR